jgi:methionyl-tRNA formyltransferase
MGLRLLQPESLRATAIQAEMSALRPDLLVVAAYGRIVPPAVLTTARMGGINLHPSLLPAYRGAAPIQRAIADGATTTGVSVIYLSDEMDAGDVILQRPVAIGPDETAGELEARLADLGAQMLVEAATLIARGTAPRIPQDHSRATYSGKISKADGRLDWSRPARELVNLVRAMNPWPCAFTTWEGSVVRVWRARPGSGNGMPGRVLSVDEEGIVVAAGEGAVVLLEIQPEGRRRMSSGEFLRGHALRAGAVLGAEV